MVFVFERLELAYSPTRKGELKGGSHTEILPLPLDKNQAVCGFAGESRRVSVMMNQNIHATAPSMVAYQKGIREKAKVNISAAHAEQAIRPETETIAIHQANARKCASAIAVDAPAMMAIAVVWSMSSTLALALQISVVDMFSGVLNRLHV